MSKKLGYTWYPKDFISDPDVMFMSSSERGVYRDLLDLAYTNDNQIKYSVEMLAKYTNSDVETVQRVLDLKGKEIDVGWSIPSCEKRLDLADKNRKNGTKGGRPKTQTKPKQNPDVNPTVTETETQSERQREREREREREKEIESECVNEITPAQNFSSYGKQPIETLKKNCAGYSEWLTVICKKNSLTMDRVLEWLDSFELHLLGKGTNQETESEFKRYFNSWITSEIRQGRTPQVKPPPEQKQKIDATSAMQNSLIKKYGHV